MKRIFIPLMIVQSLALIELIDNTLISLSTVFVFVLLWIGITYCAYQCLDIDSDSQHKEHTI